MTTNVGLEWLRPELDRCRVLIADHKSPRRWTKSDQGHGELVTEVDVAVERLLIDAIRERMPDAAILSEESSPDRSALEQETCFVIDPIDGTEEFAAGRPGFGIEGADEFFARPEHTTRHDRYSRARQHDLFGCVRCAGTTTLVVGV